MEAAIALETKAPAPTTPKRRASAERPAGEAVPSSPEPGHGDPLPATLYRSHVAACGEKANAYTFDFMSDYLTMMDVLAKSVARCLADECGVTTLQYRIMLRLLDGDATRTGTLAQSLGVGASTVSVGVAKLADAGAVERHEGACDMRAIDLGLTERGRALVRRADAAVVGAMGGYWRSLTREQLAAALESSRAAVRRHSAPRMEGGRQRLDTALMDTVMISRMLTSKALQAHGLALNDFRALLALRVLGGESTATAIAGFLFLNASDLTSCLKGLEAMRLISRERSADNRRVRVVRLTEAGRERLVELMPVVFDALHETCHSDEKLIRVHISAARDLVARRRQQAAF